MIFNHKNIRDLLLLILGILSTFFYVMLWRHNFTQSRIKNILSTNEIREEEVLIMADQKMKLLLANDTRLVQHIREKVLQNPSKQEYNLDEKKVYSEMSKWFTWKSIKNFLMQLFVDEPPGFFVEAGALDGQFLSNSLWLEREKLWKGLLIEPDPSSYSALRKKNRKAWSANACLSTFPYPVNVSLSGYTIPFKGDATEQDYRWIYKGHSHVLHSEVSDESRDYQVALMKTYFTSQCYPLETFLLALNVRTVDFLSLDIQGGEWDVLRLLPLDRIYFRTLSVEYIEPDKPLHTMSPSFIKFMEQKDYQLVGTTNEPDYLFIHKNETKLISKLVKS